MSQLPDSFALAPDAQTTLAQLIKTVPTFSHLFDARLIAIRSQRVPMLHGAPCQALIAKVRTQGEFKYLYDWLLASFLAPVLALEDPDFLVLIDAALWPTLGHVGQERLLFHELSHIVGVEDPDTGVLKLGKDGRAMLKLMPHDHEFFESEVRRYGPVVCGLEGAAVAIADGFRVTTLHEVA